MTYSSMCEGLCTRLFDMELALASERIEVLRRHGDWCDVVDVPVSVDGRSAVGWVL